MSFKGRFVFEIIPNKSPIAIWMNVGRDEYMNEWTVDSVNLTGLVITDEMPGQHLLLCPCFIVYIITSTLTSFLDCKFYNESPTIPRWLWPSLTLTPTHLEIFDGMRGQLWVCLLVVASSWCPEGANSNDLIMTLTSTYLEIFDGMRGQQWVCLLVVAFSWCPEGANSNENNKPKNSACI